MLDSTAPDTSDSGSPADTGTAGDAADSSLRTDSAPPTDGSPPPGDGSSEASPLTATAPAIGCTDTLTDVYVTPPGLPPMTPALRGDIVRCAPDVTYAVSDVQTQIAAKGVTTVPTSGVSFYRIAYRTTRGNGAGGVSTARVYLPSAPLALPLPLIVVGHPTDGLAASCAPSLDLTSNQDLALPWAGLGYAVIVPDYAGLGNDDVVQGYVDNHDTGYSLLDGARALRNFLAQGVFTSQVVLSGWSQGGGAVLAAQALAKTYGSGGTLAAVLVFAAEYQTRMNSFGYVSMLNNPTELTIATGISYPEVAVFRQYAYDSLYLGPSHAADSFPAANQAGITGAITTLCQTPFGGYLQAFDVHVSDFIDDTFRTTLLACINGAAGCVDPGMSYYAFLQQNILTADSSGPPMLYVQGLADYIMPPASEAACNIAKLQADGVSPQVCVDALAQHTNVVGRNMDFALQWGEAVLKGDALPTCSAAGMPACTP
jgi:dienelactone hydrolase